MDNLSAVVILCVLVSLLVSASMACPYQCTCENRKLRCRGKNLKIPRSVAGLTKLDYSSNWIRNLTGDTFKAVEFASAQHLNLSNNDIRVIEVSAFECLTNLTSLDISSNKLTYIDPQLFASNKLLFILYLNKNVNLNISENTVYDLAALQKLEMEQCGLTTLSVNFFINMTNLTYLYLGNNNLSSLDGNIFNHLESLKELDLSGNQFSQLPQGLQNLHMSINVHLTDNPWECDCKLRHAVFHRQWVRKLKCQSPEELRGKDPVEEGECVPETTTECQTIAPAEGEDVEVIQEHTRSEDGVESPTEAQASEERSVGHLESHVGPGDSSSGVISWVYCCALMATATVVVFLANKVVQRHKRHNKAFSGQLEEEEGGEFL